MTNDAGVREPGRVLVWGACGFMGRHLVSALLSNGCRVAVLTRQRTRYVTPAWADDVEWHEVPAQGDTQRVLDAAVASVDVIYDMAGSTGTVESNHDPLDSLRRNNVPMLDLLGAVRRAARRPHIVFASSRLVYGKPTRLPVDEDHPLAPQSVYAAHKLCCEHYLQVFAAQGILSYTIARISNVYGPDLSRAVRPHGMVNAFIRQALERMPIRLFGGGEQLRDQMYVADVVEVLVACGFRYAAENVVFNVGTGLGVSLHDVAERVCRLTGGGLVERVPWPAAFAMVETGDYVTDPARLGRVLGVTPRWSLEEGLEATVAAYRAVNEDASTARQVTSPASSA